MEIEQSASINRKSDEEIAKENEERREKKKERNREYQRAWRQRKKDLKKKDSKEEKKEKQRKRHRENQRAYYQRTKEEKKEEKRKRHRENQRAYYQRTKGLKEYYKNLEELFQKKLDDLQMKQKKLDSNEHQENVVQCRASQNVENVQLEQNQFLTQQLRIYKESHKCITPKVILHRTTDIPGAGQDESKVFECLECLHNFDSARFVCVMCEHYDVCMYCATSEAHKDHYLLRVPKHSKQKETRKVVEAIRAQLNDLQPGIFEDDIEESRDTTGESEDTIGQEDDETDLEVIVKQEPLDEDPLSQGPQPEFSRVEIKVEAEALDSVNEFKSISNVVPITDTVQGCSGSGDGEPKSKKSRLTDDDKCRLESTTIKLGDPPPEFSRVAIKVEAEALDSVNEFRSISNVVPITDTVQGCSGSGDGEPKSKKSRLTDDDECQLESTTIKLEIEEYEPFADRMLETPHVTKSNCYTLKFTRRTVFAQWCKESGPMKQRRINVLRTLHNWLPKSTQVDITKLETCVNKLCERFETYKKQSRGDYSSIVNNHLEWFDGEEVVNVPKI